MVKPAERHDRSRTPPSCWKPVPPRITAKYLPGMRIIAIIWNAAIAALLMLSVITAFHTGTTDALPYVAVAALIAITLGTLLIVVAFKIGGWTIRQLRAG